MTDSEADTETETDSDILSVFELIRKDYGQKNEILDIKPLNQSRIIHKLSHQHLHITFFKVEVKGVLIIPETGIVLILDPSTTAFNRCALDY